MFAKSITTFALAFLAGTAAAVRAQDSQDGGLDRGEAAAAAEPVHETKLGASAQKDYWGFGIGYVFNKIPVSLSTFDVGMTDLWYSHIFGNPNDQTRVAGTLGFYGFSFLLPVPRVGVEYYVGAPDQTVQGKIGVGGFYDVAVGGHGGLSGTLGVILKNRVDINFLFVPVGTDSKRSYSEFLGMESKEEADRWKAEGHKWVELPYYGAFIGLRF